MKKLIFLVLFSLIGLASLFPQPFHGGILFGFTASQVDGDSYAGYNKSGMQGGFFITTRLSNHIDARLEIKYTARGAKKPMSDDNTGLYKLGLHYIDLPLLATFNIKQLGCIELGVVPGYLFAANGEDDAGKLPNEYLVAFRKFDLGTLIGMNINVLPKFSVNLRYSYSILSINEGSSDTYYSWLGQILGHSVGDYNNYLSFGINYLIK
jgi:hypothetical protein